MKTRETPYKWSWVEALRAYLRALACDAGVEKILRNNLRKHGISEKVIRAGEKLTTCLVAGPIEGQPLILLHGTPGSALSWWPYLKDPQGFRIWALDRPGFSPLNRKTPETEKDMSFLNALLSEATEKQPAIIAGHSMGGGLAAKLAADFPELVKGLVLIGASLDPELEEIKPIQYAALKAPLRFFLNRTAQKSNEELIKYPQFLQGLIPDLEKIKCPVLAIHARDDGLVPFKNVSFMEKRLIGASAFNTQIYDRGGHDIHCNKYNEILKEIERRF